MKSQTTQTVVLITFVVLCCGADLRAQAAPPPEPTVTLWITAIRKGQPVADLTKQDLRVWIHKEQQPVIDLKFNPSGPLTLGLLVDMSRSNVHLQNLQGRFRLSADFLAGVIRPGDQAFLVDFNDLVYLEAGPTSDSDVLRSALAKLKGALPRGGTALYEAVKTASDSTGKLAPSHRALVILTDGDDDASRTTLRDAISSAQKTGVQLYTVQLTNHSPRSAEKERGGKVLRKMAKQTGGRYYAASNGPAMQEAFDSIAQTLRAQYKLVFEPIGFPSRKKPEKIKIECSRPGVEIAAPEEY